MKVMIVVTHLLGTGHLARALTLARAYSAAGDTACVVSGGQAAPMLDAQGITLVQLPPLRSNGIDFTRLLTPDGDIATPRYMAERQKSLNTAFEQFHPDVLVTELFPFGRRILRAEFQNLLALARSRNSPPLVCASIRDILAPPSKPAKAAFAEEMIGAYYDAVLVHSDPHVAPLEASWPVSDRLRPFLHYTGFVTPPQAGPHPQAVGTGEIIVSAGGGDVGGPVYRAAVDMAAQMAHPLRVLVGGSAPHAMIDELRRQASGPVIIEPARRDFRQMLTHAAASVSLCGYNTALDILQAGTPAVFVPFDEGSEVEQGLRAAALAKHSGIELLPRALLDPTTLAKALERVLRAPRRAPSGFRFDGAAQTVAITREMDQAR